MTCFLRKEEESYFKKGICSQNEYGRTQQKPITKRLPCSPGSYLSLRKTSRKGPWERLFVRRNMARVRQLTSDLQTET